MSWSNPTPEEAEQNYYYYKNKYYYAANQRNQSIKQEEKLVAEKNSASSTYNNLSNQKINLEKRLEALVRIIAMLEGTGGWLSVNVPDVISKAVNSVTKADEEHRNSIRLSGGAAAASLVEAFKPKTVESDANSAAALAAYKSEKTSLENQISDLKTQIANTAAAIDSLNSKISSCNSLQADLKNVMNSSSYEMLHYQKFLP